MTGMSRERQDLVETEILLQDVAMPLPARSCLHGSCESPLSRNGA